MSSVKEETPMELGSMQRAEEEDEEEYDKDTEEDADDALFFMEPNHDKIRAQEDLETQEYWEADSTAETINAFKQGNMDHAQKTCYHRNRKGHITANFLARKKLDAKPWTKRPGPREKRTTVHKGYGRGQGKSFSGQPGPSKRRFTGSAQSIQQSEEDF